LDAATGFHSRRLFQKDNDLRQRLGIEAPKTSSDFFPDDVVEVTSGGGAAQLATILNKPFPGIFRICGQFSVKRWAELCGPVAWRTWRVSVSK